MIKINLENNGERMDIDYYNMSYDSFDTYQKSHFKRYEFAKTLVAPTDVVGDMACGSGYGSLMLAENCSQVYGYDIDEMTINEINERYSNESKVKFFKTNLLDLKDENTFDKIVSFETIEHFTEVELIGVLDIFHKSLKDNGMLVFSTPYNQECSPISMRFHKAFYLNEGKLSRMLAGKFEIEKFLYQDYDSHDLKDDDGYKHFIICIARKK